MNREEKKSQNEKRWAEIFFCHINKAYGFDYEANSLPNNIQATDVKGISKTGKFNELNLELTVAQKWIKDVNLSKDDIKKGAALFDLDDRYIQEAITKKIDKYSKKKLDLSNIILLIQGYLHREWMLDYILQLKQKNISAPFKGIYYVFIGSNNETSFVMEIKKAFD